MEPNLEKYLHENIPLSAAMGVKVDFASKDHVILSAPFLPNINHKKTVFGGSLHAVATLACWSLLHVNKSDLQIVIANSEVQYLMPVTKSFKAECKMPEPAIWERFAGSLERRGRARLHLQAKIFEEGVLCVDYAAAFVGIIVSSGG